MDNPEDVLKGYSPAIVVHKKDGPAIALPQDLFEHEKMEGFQKAGHPESMQATLTNILGMISDARDKVVFDDPLFDRHPVDLDNELLALIDRV